MRVRTFTEDLVLLERTANRLRPREGRSVEMGRALTGERAGERARPSIGKNVVRRFFEVWLNRLVSRF